MACEGIFALASGAGRAGVAVIRLSGGPVRAALHGLGVALPRPRVATLATLTDPASGARIDRGLVLWFPGPASFTGEDMAELHVHGGPAVIDAMLGALAAIPGMRLAEPGEFTRRAFENDKLDLTAAEGLGDLVAAETDAQRRLALGQLGGALAARYDGWREQLLDALAHAEAAIDFSEEDLPDGLEAEAREAAARVRDEIRTHAGDNRGERIRSGIEIAIIGPPNAGKSSLLNRLAERDAAIVTPRAGTTRDIIEVQLDLAGFPVTIADTAGLHDSPGDEIEVEGVRRAMARGARADIRLVVCDWRCWPRRGAALEPLLDGKALVVLNKIDLAGDAATRGVTAPPDALRVSARTGSGLGALHNAITARVRGAFETGEAAPLTRARHREALVAAEGALTRAIAAPEWALFAEDLRLAVRALARITGRVDVEDVLDRVFAEFCIGK